MSRKRIAFIGDLQYATAEEERFDLKTGQIRALSPDLAVIMGDIGGSRQKSVEGFTETREIAEMLGCPYEVILGNHDVEYAPFDPVIFRYEEVFDRVFTGKKRFNAFGFGGALIICVSCERRPPEDFRTHNAVYVSDGQFAAVKAALDANPGVPAVLVTHAPLAGSGFRRCVPLHCAATDGYMDQGFDPLRWRRLLSDCPQIKMSVSAHFHLSHEYDSAVTYRDGVVHVSCGAMTVCARDDIKQTRLMDVDGERAILYTLDHASGGFRKDAEVDLTGAAPPTGRFSFVREGELPLGEDNLLHAWSLPEYGRAYLATEKGLLWEYSRELDEFTGAITLKAGAEEISVYDGRLYFRAFDGSCYSVGLESSGRLDRIDGCVPQEIRPEPELKGRVPETNACRTRRAKDGIYAAIEVNGL